MFRAIRRKGEGARSSLERQRRLFAWGHHLSICGQADNPRRAGRRLSVEPALPAERTVAATFYILALDGLDRGLGPVK